MSGLPHMVASSLAMETGNTAGANEKLHFFILYNFNFKI